MTPTRRWQLPRWRRAHLTDQMVQLAKSNPDTVFAQIEHRVWNEEVRKAIQKPETVSPLA